MLKHRLTLLGCGVALLGVAGCGSSSKKSTSTTAAAGLPLSQFVSKADPICARANAQRRAINSPHANPLTASSATVKTFASYLRGTAASLSLELAQIRALGTPQTGAATLQKALASGDQSVAVQTAAAQAAAKGDVSAFRAEFLTLVKLSPPRELKSLGFKICGHA
jgi:hypothetical protein